MSGTEVEDDLVSAGIARERDIQELQSDLCHVRGELKRAQSDRETLSTQLEELRRKETESKTEVEAKRNELVRLRNIEQEHEQLWKDHCSLQLHVAELTGLSEDLKESRTNHRVLTDELDASRGEVERLVEERSRLIEMVESLRCQIAEERERSERYKAELLQRLETQANNNLSRMSRQLMSELTVLDLLKGRRNDKNIEKTDLEIEGKLDDNGCHQPSDEHEGMEEQMDSPILNQVLADCMERNPSLLSPHRPKSSVVSDLLSELLQSGAKEKENCINEDLDGDHNINSLPSARLEVATQTEELEKKEDNSWNSYVEENRYNELIRVMVCVRGKCAQEMYQWRVRRLERGLRRLASLLSACHNKMHSDVNEDVLDVSSSAPTLSRERYLSSGPGGSLSSGLDTRSEGADSGLGSGGSCKDSDSDEDTDGIFDVLEFNGMDAVQRIEVDEPVDPNKLMEAIRSKMASKFGSKSNDHQVSEDKIKLQFVTNCPQLHESGSQSDGVEHLNKRERPKTHTSAVNKPMEKSTVWNNNGGENIPDELPSECELVNEAGGNTEKWLHACESHIHELLSQANELFNNLDEYRQLSVEFGEDRAKGKCSQPYGDKPNRVSSKSIQDEQEYHEGGVEEWKEQTVTVKIIEYRCGREDVVCREEWHIKDAHTCRRHAI